MSAMASATTFKVSRCGAGLPTPRRSKRFVSQVGPSVTMWNPDDAGAESQVQRDQRGLRKCSQIRKKRRKFEPVRPVLEPGWWRFLAAAAPPLRCRFRGVYGQLRTIFINDLLGRSVVKRAVAGLLQVLPAASASSGGFPGEGSPWLRWPADAHPRPTLDAKATSQTSARRGLQRL